ncbi:MAG: Nif11-like leader peptide family natural product precursor [Desulfobacterales bacterium]|nr:Nif11-like leader peptide family natural product precursor [Desulfobacterales bacterium]
MSIESAKALLERMKTDEDFRKEVGEIATAEERIAFVTAVGFDFTKEELENVQEKMQLTDEELGSVAGGGQKNGAWCECPQDFDTCRVE